MSEWYKKKWSLVATRPSRSVDTSKRSGAQTASKEQTG